LRRLLNLPASWSARNIAGAQSDKFRQPVKRRRRTTRSRDMSSAFQSEDDVKGMQPPRRLHGFAVFTTIDHSVVETCSRNLRPSQLAE